MEVLGFQYDVEALLSVLRSLLKVVTVLVLLFWTLAGAHVCQKWLSRLHDYQDRSNEHSDVL